MQGWFAPWFLSLATIHHYPQHKLIRTIVIILDIIIIVNLSQVRVKINRNRIQSNLDYPDLEYPDFSIIRTFSLVPIWS